MTAFGGLLTVLTLTGIAVVLALVTPARYRSLASGGASMGIGIAGIFTGVSAITTPPKVALVIPIAVPGGLGLDPLAVSYTHLTLPTIYSV